MSIKLQADKKVKEIKLLLSQNNIFSSPVSEKQYNFEFSATKSNESVKVLFYFGKKGVTIVLQGNKETSLYANLDSLINGTNKSVAPVREIKEPSEYIGSDETGKGDFFGPLVATAFFSDEPTRNKLATLGVKDSKLLSDTQINRIAIEIKDLFPNQISTVLIAPEKYNVLYSQLNNLNKLLNWAHSKAINELLKKQTCVNFIVDKFSSEQIHLENPPKSGACKFQYITKGERFLGVAAASILARHEMNRWFDGNTHLGFDLPKGAGKNVDEIAQMIVNTEGLINMKKIAKMHFKTLKKLKL